MNAATWEYPHTLPVRPNLDVLTNNLGELVRIRILMELLGSNEGDEYKKLNDEWLQIFHEIFWQLRWGINTSLHDLLEKAQQYAPQLLSQSLRMEDMTLYWYDSSTFLQKFREHYRWVVQQVLENAWL